MVPNPPPAALLEPGTVLLELDTPMEPERPAAPYQLQFRGAPGGSGSTGAYTHVYRMYKKINEHILLYINTTVYEMCKSIE